MDIRINAEVQCTDGPGGHVKCIILNPVTQQITDVVVHEPGLLSNEVIIPVSQIAQSSPDSLQLRISRNELAGMQNFLTTQYRLPDDAFLKTATWHAYPYGGIYWAPYLEMETEQLAMTYENIPFEALLKEETIDEEELVRVLGPRSAPGNAAIEPLRAHAVDVAVR